MSLRLGNDTWFPQCLEFLLASIEKRSARGSAPPSERLRLPLGAFVLSTQVVAADDLRRPRVQLPNVTESNLLPIRPAMAT